MNDIVVYTAITGSYDELKSVYEVNDNMDYICFTDYDFQGKIREPWKQVRLPQSVWSNKDLARYCKLNPHLLLPQYKKSLWIDGNITILTDPYEKIIEVLTVCDVASYDHWWRETTEQEFYICAKIGFDFAWKLRRQNEKYLNDGYISTQFFENNVVFRNHNANNMPVFHDFWWKEYLCGGKRDQYSFTYSAFKTDINILSLGEHDPRLCKIYFDYCLHAKAPESMKLKLVRFVNHIYIYLSRWNVADSKKINRLS